MLLCSSICWLNPTSILRVIGHWLVSVKISTAAAYRDRISKRNKWRRYRRRNNTSNWQSTTYYLNIQLQGDYDDARIPMVSHEITKYSGCILFIFNKSAEVSYYYTYTGGRQPRLEIKSIVLQSSLWANWEQQMKFKCIPKKITEELFGIQKNQTPQIPRIRTPIFLWYVFYGCGDGVAHTFSFLTKKPSTFPAGQIGRKWKCTTTAMMDPGSSSYSSSYTRSRLHLWNSCDITAPSNFLWFLRYVKISLSITLDLHRTKSLDSISYNQKSKFIRFILKYDIKMSQVCRMSAPLLHKKSTQRLFVHPRFQWIKIKIRDFSE